MVPLVIIVRQYGRNQRFSFVGVAIIFFWSSNLGSRRGIIADVGTRPSDITPKNQWTPHPIRTGNDPLCIQYNPLLDGYGGFSGPSEVRFPIVLAHFPGYSDTHTYSELFKSTNSDVIKSYIGLRPFYFVAGQQNIQRLFGSPEILDGDFLHFILMGKQWGMTKAELAKFREDKSGRLAKPLPGSENLDPEKRYWRNHNGLYTDYLTDTKHSGALVAEFSRRFLGRLDQQVVDVDDGWTTVSLLETVRTHMFECAVETLFGTQVFELNPGFTKCYWEYDEVAPRFLGGLPPFLQPRNARIKARIHAMVRRHIDAAWANFDWDGPPAQSLWEPHFGSRLSRESARWLREQGFSDHVIAGHTTATLFG